MNQMAGSTTICRSEYVEVVEGGMGVARNYQLPVVTKLKVKASEKPTIERWPQKFGRIDS